MFFFYILWNTDTPTHKTHPPVLHNNVLECSQLLCR